MANTLGIAGISLANSAGTFVYTGGQSDFSVSLGVASYSFSSGEWGYLGKANNKWYENLGYSFGALANVQDILQESMELQLKLNLEKNFLVIVSFQANTMATIFLCQLV